MQRSWQALGHHELVVAAHVDNTTVGDGHDDWGALRAILGRCAFTRSQRLVAGCAAFRAAPVTTHHAQPEPHQRLRSAEAIVRSQSGQVKLQNRNWNLTLSVF
jgi:hypothetical protein